MNKNKNQKGFSAVELGIVLTVISMVSGIGIFVFHSRSVSKPATSTIPSFAPKEAVSNSTQQAELQKTADAASSIESGAIVNKTTSSVATKPSSTPLPAPAPAPNTTSNAETNGCLPPNASVYAKYYIGMSNSAYLQTNSYIETTKFRNALNYAGLLGTIDAKKTVVFAVSDYVFNNNLSASQLAYMNASPANMKSVLGWHIITSCVIWSNYIENVKSPITLNTLNGPVIYDPTTGTVNGSSMGIWDWFTSNGAVHIISNLIAPPPN